MCNNESAFLWHLDYREI